MHYLDVNFPIIKAAHLPQIPVFFMVVPKLPKTLPSNSLILPKKLKYRKPVQHHPKPPAFTIVVAWVLTMPMDVFHVRPVKVAFALWYQVRRGANIRVPASLAAYYFIFSLYQLCRFVGF